MGFVKKNCQNLLLHSLLRRVSWNPGPNRFWSAKLLTTHDVKSNIERFQLHSSFNLFYSPLSLTKSLHFHSSLRFARDGILTNEPIPKLCLTLLRLSLVTNFRQPNINEAKNKFNIRKTKQKSIIKHIVTSLHTKKNERFAFVRSFLKMQTSIKLAKRRKNT